MHYCYNLLTSILLTTCTASIAMQNQTPAASSLMINSILNASTSRWNNHYRFDVQGFKQYFKQNSSNITPQNLCDVERQMRILLKDNQLELVLLYRDYTASMIAINRIHPNSFPISLITTRINAIEKFYGNSQPTNNVHLHASKHRWGTCQCPHLTGCNWPLLQ